MNHNWTLLNKFLFLCGGIYFIVLVIFSFSIKGYIEQIINNNQILLADSYLSLPDGKAPLNKNVTFYEYESGSDKIAYHGFVNRVEKNFKDLNKTNYYEWTLEGDLLYALRTKESMIRFVVIDGSISKSIRVASNSFLVLGVVVSFVVLIVFTWYLLYKLVVAPITSIRETTARFLRGDTSARSNLRTSDEYEYLGRSLNNLLDEINSEKKDFERIKKSLDLKVEELAEANVDLFENTKLKSEFLANVSHELRTPMNSIIGFCELLEEESKLKKQFTKKHHRYITNILMSSRSLRDMISELLDLAKIEAGRFEVDVRKCNLIDLLSGLVEIMRPQAESKDIEVNILTSLEVYNLETDNAKLQQILHNIFANAIKFSPEGGVISVGVRPYDISEDISGVRVSIRDYGPGIPADMLEVIFEKFRQVESGHTRSYGGTGLGLAICRELADMINVKVSVESVQGRGSTFHVDIPLNWIIPPQPALMG